MRKSGAIFAVVVACACVWSVGGLAVDWLRQRPPVDMALPPIADGGGVLRIAVLGTSLSARASWPGEVERLLEHCLGRGVDMIRLAKPGATSDWGVAQGVEIGAFQPDLVIVEFAINDGDLLDGLSRSRSKANHEALITAVKARGAAVLLVTTNPVGRLATLKRPLLPVYHDIYLSLARAMGTGLFDGERRWRQFPGWRAALPDGVHPDPAVEAQLFAAPMAGLIAWALGAECAPDANP